MPPSTQPPMDYATRNSLATVERLLIKKVISETDAQSLVKAIAAERRPVPTPAPRHPDEEIEARIA